MVLPRGHKRSVSDQTATMSSPNKQGGGSPRYAFRNKALTQGFSPLKSSGPKAKAVKLPKHVPQTWNTNTAGEGGSGDEAPVKAFTPALKPLPIAPAELTERMAGESLAPIADADDENDVGSTTAQASTVSQPSAERYITSAALGTPAATASASAAAGASASGFATPAIPAPTTGTGAAAGGFIGFPGFPSHRRPARMDAPMPTPPDEPVNNAVGPVSGPILNYFNVQRQLLTEPPMTRAFDYWTRLNPDGTTVEAPKLPGCGPWEIPLPPNMDVRLHIDGNVGLIFNYLGVYVASTRWPPSVKIDLFTAQRVHETVTPFLVEDNAAARWRAWKIIFDWAEQLKIHGSAPSNPPLDIITFIRNRAHQAGRLARESALRVIESGQNGPMFGGQQKWQLPSHINVVCAPLEAAARANAARPNVAQNQAQQNPAPARNAGANNAQKKQVAKKTAVPKTAAPKAAASKNAGSKAAGSKAAAPKKVAPKTEPGTAGSKRQAPVIHIPSDSEEEYEDEQPQPKKRRQAK